MIGKSKTSTGGYHKSRSQTIEKTRRSQRKAEFIPSRNRVFVMTPKELQEQWESYGDEMENYVAPPITEEELLDMDSELEILDEDMISIDETVGPPAASTFVKPGAEPEFVISPEVSLGEVYSLVVFPDREGRWLCRFEIPRWMFSFIPVENREYIHRLRNFLEALANWLEKEKQEFLRRPTPENFVRKEDCRPGNCLLQQKVFLQRLHSFVNHGITEADFSRLQDKIWLFWPDQSMPLSAVFSGPQTAQFRLAWVIEGCFRKYLESELHWRETRRYPDGFTREELELMGSRFELLDPEERLYLLCREVEMVKKIDQVYRAVIERVNKHAQN